MFGNVSYNAFDKIIYNIRILEATKSIMKGHQGK
jgi:hypothetical protein